MPPLVRWCMKSWKKKLPGYRFKRWDESNFDVASVPFVKEAYEARKYAFVADYVRLYALYTEGGVYLDTDVRLLKPLGGFLEYDFVAAHEYHPGLFAMDRDKVASDGTVKERDRKIRGLGVGSAVMLAVPGHPYIKDCMEFYSRRHFVDGLGRPRPGDFIVGWTLSKTAEKYGYRYGTRTEELSCGMRILPPDVFVHNSLFLDRHSHAVHLCMGSWHDAKAGRAFHPGVSYAWMRLKCKLRRVKHLFLGKQRVRDIYGDWF